MTEMIMAEIITNDELTLISLPKTEDGKVIWSVFDKLCDKSTKIRIIYSKDGFGTKQTEITWPTSQKLIDSALNVCYDITTDVCLGSKDFKLSSIPFMNISNLFWCSKSIDRKLPLVSLIRKSRDSQSLLGLEIRINKKQYAIGFIKR